MPDPERHEGTYNDPLEKAILEHTVDEVESQPCAIVSADTSILQAVQRLANLEVACLVVAEKQRLVGVFTIRDVLDKVALQFEEVKHRLVSEVMTSRPEYVYDTDSVAAAMCVMVSGGHRHVPVVDSDERIIGIVSPNRVMTFLQHNLVHE